MKSAMGRSQTFGVNLVNGWKAKVAFTRDRPENHVIPNNVCPIAYRKFAWCHRPLAFETPSALKQLAKGSIEEVQDASGAESGT